MVFQEPRLLPWKRVAANVALGVPGGPARRAARALAEVGLADRGRGLAGELSGGEAQRVALARPWCASRGCCCSTSRSARSTR